ncbi:MAG: ACT domain-containing protein [archaeon]
MTSISQVVRKLIESKPLLYESLSEGIVSYQNLAEKIHREIENDLGKKAELPAIIMAIRRYSENIKPLINEKIPFKFNTEIIMKTGLMDLSILKTHNALSKLRQIYDIIDFEKGDTFNVIQGNYEISIVINNKHKDKITKSLKGEKILNIENDLVSLTMSFSKEFLYTVGILAKVTRKLAWENINIYENISTMTELIFIVNKKDATRAYKVLQELVDENL